MRVVEPLVLVWLSRSLNKPFGHSGLDPESYSIFMATAASPKIRIKIKAYDHRVIDAAARVIIETTERTGALIAGPIPLPTKIRKFTVLKSTFVHKDARDQFEIRTHKRIIDITESTSKTIDALSNITLPAGVEIEVKMLTA